MKWPNRCRSSEIEPCCRLVTAEDSSGSKETQEDRREENGDECAVELVSGGDSGMVVLGVNSCKVRRRSARRRACSARPFAFAMSTSVGGFGGMTVAKAVGTVQARTGWDEEGGGPWSTRTVEEEWRHGWLSMKARAAVADWVMQNAMPDSTRWSIETSKELQGERGRTQSSMEWTPRREAVPPCPSSLLRPEQTPMYITWD